MAKYEKVHAMQVPPQKVKMHRLFFSVVIWVRPRLVILHTKDTIFGASAKRVWCFEVNAV